MTNQDLPDDLQPGDKIGDVVLKDSDFDGATLRTRDVWKFLYERSNYQLVRSPRTASPPDRGQSTMNISSRDTRPRDLEKDFSASSEEESEEEEEEEDKIIKKTARKNTNSNNNNNNNNNNMNRNTNTINKNEDNNNNNNGVRAPPQRPPVDLQTILNRPVTTSEVPPRSLVAEDRERFFLL